MSQRAMLIPDHPYLNQLVRLTRDQTLFGGTWRAGSIWRCFQVMTTTDGVLRCNLKSLDGSERVISHCRLEHVRPKMIVETRVYTAICDLCKIELKLGEHPHLLAAGQYAMSRGWQEGWLLESSARMPQQVHRCPNCRPNPTAPNQY